jgi:hypothetical protein
MEKVHGEFSGKLLKVLGEAENVWEVVDVVTWGYHKVTWFPPMIFVTCTLIIVVYEAVIFTD